MASRRDAHVIRVPAWLYQQVVNLADLSDPSDRLVSPATERWANWNPCNYYMGSGNYPVPYPGRYDRAAPEPVAQAPTGSKPPVLPGELTIIPHPSPLSTRDPPTSPQCSFPDRDKQLTILERRQLRRLVKRVKQSVAIFILGNSDYYSNQQIITNLDPGRMVASIEDVPAPRANRGVQRESSGSSDDDSSSPSPSPSPPPVHIKFTYKVPAELEESPAGGSLSEDVDADTSGSQSEPTTSQSWESDASGSVVAVPDAVQNPGQAPQPVGRRRPKRKRDEGDEEWKPDSSESEESDEEEKAGNRQKRRRAYRKGR